MNGLELPTVLNVDDNEARRYAKSRILKRGGYQVIESETGADVLRVIKEFQPKSCTARCQVARYHRLRSLRSD